jgi:NadR type nicotinamide-nucleotide adenylyltransferase
MRKYRNALVVGKFSPLHKGHEYIIRTALQECEKLFVFSYSNPEFRGCEAFRRNRWLKTLFPQAEIFVITSEFLEKRYNFSLPKNDASDLEHRRFCGFLWLELVNEPLDAVFTSESYGEGFAAELSRYFALYSDLPIVKHILVDLERTQIPVSGTEVRQNIHSLKHLLSTEVYASFVKTVCFLGGESTGKSTLTEVLAREFKTIFVPEYGRTLWEEQTGQLLFEDLLKIAKTHVRHEENLALQASEFLFVDTSPLTTMLYSEFLFNRVDPELVWLSQRKYDFTFLCAPDIPFVQDGTRVDEGFRQWQHQKYLQLLESNQIDYALLTGSFTERIEKVRNVLSKNINF